MIEYYNPVDVIFGKKKINKIARYADKYAMNKKVLLVSGRKAMREQGITTRIENLLKKSDYEVKNFEKAEANPTPELIDEGVNILRDGDFGLVVGLGGGSAMDCAKCMAILVNNEGSVIDYLENRRKLVNDGIPLIEIPTTSGTGSEVTMWSTIWDASAKKKYSLSDRKMYAKAAVVDPELTIGLTQRMTATTGMDALCQAIEAYWSRNHNPTSDKHALKAIKLIYENIENAYKDPSSITAREKMALGSLEAGLAFSNTKTTAVHSVSYPITAHFGVPHGLACALTLGSFIKYNSVSGNDNMPEGAERVKKIVNLLGCKSSEQSAERIVQMMKDMGLPTRLNEIGINEKDIDIIIKEGFTPDRVVHNPRIVTEESLRNLLRELL